jgi:hypothetical protein
MLGHAAHVIRRQIGTRKTSPLPEDSLESNRRIIEGEAADFDDFDPTGQRFGGLPRKFRRSTAEIQKGCRLFCPVGQHTQHRDQTGLPLRFINHHQSPQSLHCDQPRKQGKAFEERALGRLQKNECSTPPECSYQSEFQGGSGQFAYKAAPHAMVGWIQKSGSICVILWLTRFPEF